MMARKGSLDAVRALTRAAAEWRRLVNINLLDAELSASRYAVLEAVAEASKSEAGKQGISQQLIADQLGMDKMTASQLIRALTAEGLMERRRRTGERAWRVRITDNGRTLYGQTRGLVQIAADAFWGEGGARLALVSEALEQGARHAAAETARIEDAYLENVVPKPRRPRRR
jgi:DNA-binding MarR family transcriptional regulator